MAKRRFRSRGRFRRRFRRRGGSKRLRKFVKRVIRSYTEVKYSTASFIYIATDLTQPSIQLLNPNIPQGVSKQARIGQKIIYKMLTVNFDFFFVNTAAPNLLRSQTFRVLIIQQRVAFNNPIQVGDIFDDANNFLSTLKGQSVRVMKDMRFVIEPSPIANPANPGPGCNSQRFTRKLHFKVRNNVTFLANAQNIPSDFKDLYYIVITTNMQGGPANTTLLSGTVFSRISFIDI